MYSKPISPSSLLLYAECPLKWSSVYIDGEWDMVTAVSPRGIDLHALLEEFFKGSAYPSGCKPLATWQPYMENLAALGGVAESKVAVDKQWQQIDYHDPSAEYRGKKDYDVVDGTELHVYDWKSGGLDYDSHEFQGEGYVCMSQDGYSCYWSRFVYLDHPHVVKEWRYTPAEVAAKRLVHSAKIQEMRQAEDYLPKPGKGCKRCTLSWRVGGPCKRAR